MARVPPRESVLQARRGGTAKKIKKVWDIKRENRWPRGLENISANCFRNGALQPLLHLPRFMNWIMQHNKAGQNWPCGLDDENRSLPGLHHRTSVHAPPHPGVFPKPKSIAEKELKMMEDTKARAVVDAKIHRQALFSTLKGKTSNGGDRIVKLYQEDDSRAFPMSHYVGCVPCLLQLLIEGYWGDDEKAQDEKSKAKEAKDEKAISKDEKAQDEEPAPVLHHTDPAIFPLHQLVDRWFTNRGGGNTAQARLDYLARNHDADEFLQKVFTGIRWSYNVLDKHGRKRKNQYDSLFTVSQHEQLTCNNCGHQSLREQEDFGLKVTPEASSPDTLEAAIVRAMTDDKNGVTCTECKKEDVNLESRFLIDAAPEYLRVLVYLIDQRTETRISNPIRVPDILDISQHMTSTTDQTSGAMRYKLLSGTFQSGEDIESGHYVSCVTEVPLPRQRDPGRQFFCNDERVTLRVDPRRANAVTANPLRVPGSAFLANVLWYERIPITVNEPAMPVDLNEGSIGQRIGQGGLARRCRISRSAA